MGSDFLTRDELLEIEERLDMSEVQRATVRHILFRIEKINHGWLRAIRRSREVDKEKGAEKKENRTRIGGQDYFMFANRSVMEFFFTHRIIDQVGGLSKLPLTFHMQELLLELVGIRDRLGERMETNQWVNSHRAHR